ncbi:YjgN family protein [Herbaspirillum sp. alder98]|uniref:YjgN family protein n=1 Tax=Herbaspirillum sp. alder98 TaxID=2913096 RepID=UPI001CD8380B|nr:YjgN family protein [Herbaspirillum sp. alder98]MCA1323202.1 DUF898 domain-containing protein [Herbaspirillum sp. alder98]
MNEHLDSNRQPDAAPPTFPTTMPAPDAPPAERFVFSGRGSEYFRIWIVNLLLSVLTLGIYSAWAKVRRLRYFYDNTTVAGTSFDYHGKPLAILKGRAIALVLLVLYHGAFQISPVIGLAGMLVVGLVAPWLIWRSLQFKLYNSSYRGIRFGLRGSAGGAYFNYLLLPVTVFFTSGLLWPMVHQRIKRFQHNESRFGATHFSFHATVGGFYKTYLLGIGIWLAGMVAIMVAFSGSMMALAQGALSASLVLTILALYTWSFLILPLFFTLLQNLIWNNTRLGPHRFTSNMNWGRMCFIALTNVIGIACTLGLYTPFAKIRAMRYRIESMSLLPASDLDEFVASTEPPGSATGEGVTDLFDFDLSL